MLLEYVVRGWGVCGVLDIVGFFDGLLVVLVFVVLLMWVILGVWMVKFLFGMLRGGLIGGLCFCRRVGWVGVLWVVVDVV